MRVGGAGSSDGLRLGKEEGGQSRDRWEGERWARCSGTPGGEDMWGGVHSGVAFSEKLETRSSAGCSGGDRGCTMITRRLGGECCPAGELAELESTQSKLSPAKT